MNIWKSLADKFDNLLPRTTAVFVKETDYSLGITYPLEELQTAFNFIFSDEYSSSVSRRGLQMVP